MVNKGCHVETRTIDFFKYQNNGFLTLTRGDCNNGYPSPLVQNEIARTRTKLPPAGAAPKGAHQN